MSKEATREDVVRTRIRYRSMTGKRAKGRVLDEFCGTTGMERKHAIKVLRAPGDPAERRGRKSTYGPDEYTVWSTTIKNSTDDNYNYPLDWVVFDGRKRVGEGNLFFPPLPRGGGGRCAKMSQLFPFWIVFFACCIR